MIYVKYYTNIKMIYSEKPTGLSIAKYWLTKLVNPSFFIKLAINDGIDIKADAKITGITPDEFNLNGI